MKFPLRLKLLALTTFVVAVVMATVTWVYTVRQVRDRKAQVESEVTRIAQSIATLQLVESQDWNAYQDYISRLTELDSDIVYVAIYDERQSLRAHTLNRALVDAGEPLPPGRRAEAELVRRLDRGGVADESRDNLRTKGVNIQVGDRVLGSVHVGFSLLDINRELRAGVRRNVGLGLVFIALSGALSLVLGGRLTRPLESLSAAMQAVGLGDLERRVEPSTRDEIAGLARSFNTMVSELRERQVIDRMGQELGCTFQRERLAGLVREQLRTALGARSARLFLREAPGALVFREASDAPPAPAASAAEVSPERRLALDEAGRKELEAAEDGLVASRAGAALARALEQAGIAGSDLVLPLLAKDHLLGLLAFRSAPGERAPGPRSIRLLRTLARPAAMALENALLYEELREQERLKSELRIASEVQARLLPRDMPHFPGFAFDAVCCPAYEVGGDYFDFHRLGPDRLGVVIADVSNKGTSASMYMAEIKGMMLSLAAAHGTPRRVLVELNRHLYPSLDRRVFASVLYGVLDRVERTFVFARAGHGPLLHVGADGKCRTVTPGGMAVGLDPGPLFERTLEERSLELAPGDGLVLVTDGVTDAMSPEMEPFGLHRLVQVIEATAGATPQELRTRLLEAVRSFTAGAPAFDDLTAVVVRVLHSAPGEPSAGGPVQGDRG